MNTMINQDAITFSYRTVKELEFQNALDAIQFTHQSHQLRVPNGLFLLGDAGVGKTFVIESYVDAHPQKELHDRTISNVLYITAEANDTIHVLLNKLLYQLDSTGDLPKTFHDKRLRLSALKRELDVQLVIIDEFHDMLPKSGYDSKSPIIRFVKMLLNQVKVAVVMAGLPEAKGVLHKDSQIKTRCNKFIQLQAFNMRDEASYKRFGSFIKALEKVYPRTLTDLFANNCEGLYRLLLATNGNKRELSFLFQAAIALTPVNQKTTFDRLHAAWLISSCDASEDLSTLPFKSSLGKVKKALVARGLK